MKTESIASRASTAIEYPSSQEVNDGRDSLAFPMSELQQAYWVGEEGGLRLGTPAFVCRRYFSQELDLARLTESIHTLYERHSMLRSYVSSDGMQVIANMTSVRPEAWISYTDWTISQECAEAFDFARMSAADEQILPTLGEPVKLKCCVHRVPGGFHINLIFRLFAVDGLSVRILLAELIRSYGGQPLSEAPRASYRAFIEEKQNAPASDAQEALASWMERAAEMPAAPQLPTVNPSRFPRRATFKRRRFVLSPDESRRIAQQARACGISLTQFICTAYVDILRMWSENKTFLLNVLTSKRPLDDEAFQHTVGNFSDTLLLEAIPCGGSFRARASGLRSQFLTAIDHSSVSGVTILRRSGKVGDDFPVLPVVFASTLGSEALIDEIDSADVGWVEQPGALNTPQVYLDHQVSMAGGRIVLNWDCVDAVFNDGVVEQMFNAYRSHLLALTAASDLAAQPWLPTLDNTHLASRIRANATARTFGEHRLDALFDTAAARYPSNVALACEQRTIDYDTLHRITTRAAHRLARLGVAPGKLVAIVAEKSWQQVAAAVSIVKSGGAYLPISTSLPPARLEYLLDTAAVGVVLAERAAMAKVPTRAGVTVLDIETFFSTCERTDEEAESDGTVPHAHTADDLAYVIFTSGSTGLPKGVAITHRAAANTIHDCIERFGLNEQDRVIGVSALNFDLSVFDIFATLACGAALVVPAQGEHPSPEAWIRCFEQHRVTVWNSVPALFEMLMEFTSTGRLELLKSLRLVMLSGDWIPLALVKKIRSLEPAPVLIGLGGATEAAIWSNFFAVETLDPNWTSIPYGWPLSNQQYHVLDEHLNDVPTWVSGQLYISGLGLAREYLGDRERTDASFIMHPSGRRMYKTGDFGRYLPDGTIEFLGRRDTQVKIRGHRIGLGEIDAVLSAMPGVEQSLTIVQELANADSRLVSFYQRVSGAVPLDAKDLLAELANRLPHYMVPGSLVALEHFPVTVNGKVDRKALLAMVQPDLGQASVDRPASDSIEQALLQLWTSVLHRDVRYTNLDFFDLGGNSLSAVRLLTRINARFGVQLQLASLLRLGTVAEQAKLIRTLAAECPSADEAPAIVRMTRGDGEGPVLLAVHPVGGNIMCYRSSTAWLPDSVEMVAFQSPGDGRQRSIGDLAHTYAYAFLQTSQASKPLHLLGWSMGGIVALELACILEGAGADVASVTLLDSWSGGKPGVQAADLQAPQFLHGFFRDLLGGADPAVDLELIASLAPSQRVPEIAALVCRKQPSLHGMTEADVADLFAEYTANYTALLHHTPALPRAPIVNYVADRTEAFRILQRVDLAGSTMADHARGRVSTIHVDEDHHSIVDPAFMQRLLQSMFNTR